MGNNQIKETVAKHQELRKQIKNDKLDKNLIIFNIPIVVDSNRGSKSYIQQITEESEEELNNTTYNELYLAGLGIKITNNDIKFIKTNELSSWAKPGENIEVLQTHDENIIKLEGVIKKLQNQINEEKSKLLQLEYVQSKLNKPIGKTNEYVRTVKYLYESLLTR